MNILEYLGIHAQCHPKACLNYISDLFLILRNFESGNMCIMIYNVDHNILNVENIRKCFVEYY